ncbi:MAG TPA: hypothetical protein VIK59_11115 [Verrucomicrobiae bacterium]
MKRLLAKAASVAFKISAMFLQRFWQTGMKIMETAQIKFRGILQAVIPLGAGDFIRRIGKSAQQLALSGALLPTTAPTFDEPDDFHYARITIKNARAF